MKLPMPSVREGDWWALIFVGVILSGFVPYGQAAWIVVICFVAITIVLWVIWTVYQEWLVHRECTRPLTAKEEQIKRDTLYHLHIHGSLPEPPPAWVNPVMRRVTPGSNTPDDGVIRDDKRDSPNS
jgi:hypothetical protein